MGTPMKNRGSDVEEEIMFVLDAAKKVLIYFWDLPTDFKPSDR